MTVAELIECLKTMPPELDVRVWDAEEDDYVAVAMALYEDGTPAVDLLTREEELAPASDAEVSQ